MDRNIKFALGVYAAAAALVVGFVGLDNTFSSSRVKTQLRVNQNKRMNQETPSFRKIFSSPFLRRKKIYAESDLVSLL